MTISPWLIYWIDVVYSICILLNILFGAALVCFAFSAAVAAVNDYEEDKKPWLALAKKLAIALVTLGVLIVFVPSKSVMMQMLIIPPVVNNEQVQQLPSNVLEYVNEWLKEAKKDLEEKE